MFSAPIFFKAPDTHLHAVSPLGQHTLLAPALPGRLPSVTVSKHGPTDTPGSGLAATAAAVTEATQQASP